MSPVQPLWVSQQNSPNSAGLHSNSRTHLSRVGGRDHPVTPAPPKVYLRKSHSRSVTTTKPPAAASTAAAGQPDPYRCQETGRIPTGGGWARGRGSPNALASSRVGVGTGRVGYTYLHTALDEHSRLAYTEALDDEKAVTAADWWLPAAGS